MDLYSARHKISNALNTLVLRQKECLQHLFEGRFCIAGISDIVRQQVPNSGAGDSKCPTAKCSVVVRQDGDVGLIAAADDPRDWRLGCSCQPGSAAPCCSDTGGL